MPASLSSNTSRRGFRASTTTTRRHRPGLWAILSSTIRRLYTNDDPRNVSQRPVERPQALEDEPMVPSTIETAPATAVHANIAPQAPAVHQPVAPPPALPVPLPLHVLHDTFRHDHGTRVNARSNLPSNVPDEQVPPVPIPSSPGRPSRGAPLQRHGAFHEHFRPYWNAGSGHEPPVVYGRSLATLPENQVWDPSWGPVPNLSVITALTHGPPTPQQVLNYLNIRFRLNRRAYCMALDILFPQPAESPTRLGIPVYQRVLETSQWRRNYPDWEGGIVPVDREVGSAHADDAADSQAGSDDEDSGDGVLTSRERRAIRSRVASLLPDAYRAHLAAEQASSASSGSASSPSTSSSRSDSVESSGDTSHSSSSPSSGSSSFSAGPGSSSSNTSSNPSSEHASSSSSSPSSTYSSYSSRKRRHDEDEGSNADSNITVVEGHPSARPATRRRLDSDGEALANTEAHPDTQALLAPPSVSPASASRHRRRSRAEGGEQEQRKLMRQYQHLSPPIGPPGVRTGGPGSASTSQGRAFTSDLDAAGPGPVAHVPAQPVAGSSRPRDDEDHVEPLPVRRSPKRLRDEDTSEMPGHLLEDGVVDDKAGKRNKKRSRKE